MKEKIEQLIEDYKRRLDALKDVFASGEVSVTDIKRLNEKFFNYKTFISELEKLLK